MPRIAGNQLNPARVGRDNYPTDPAWTRVLLRHVSLSDVWEPACGDGAMCGEIARLSSKEVVCSDIGPAAELCPHASASVDFLRTSGDVKRDIVTNPPFRMFGEFARHALGLTTGTVAMLGGVHFLGGKQRMDDLWAPNPPSLVIIVTNRMKVYDSPSQFNHAWFVWERTGAPTRLVWDYAQ